MNGINQIQTQIKALVLEKMQKVAPAIEQRAREILRTEIETCPTIRSLKGGILRAEFGIENPSDCDAIVDKWVNSLSVKVVINGGTVSLLMTAVDELYFDVLFLPEASQKIDGGQLDWLRFLLLVGGQEIVFDYYPSEANAFEAKYSRSKTATIMRKKAGSSWAVPPEYQGTLDNNFISRLCEQLQVTMANLMMEELTR